MPRFRVQEGGEGDEEDILVGQGKSPDTARTGKASAAPGFCPRHRALALLEALLK